MSTMSKINSKTILRGVLILGLLLACASCIPTTQVPVTETPEVIVEPGIEGGMVIDSHVGEVTEEVRCIDEEIRYKVYYENTSKTTGSFVITDQVHRALSEITPLDGGDYDSASRTITWKIPAVEPGGAGAVGFSARVGEARVIQNAAVFTLRDGTEFKTNLVETRVCSQPELGWIPFTRGADKGAQPRAYMKDQTTTGLMVNFEIPGMWASEQVVAGTTYHQLSLPGYTAINQVGRPALPVIGRIVEVPLDVDLKVEIVKSSKVSLDCYNIIPYQDRYDSNEVPEVFTIDGPAYQASVLYPGELATVTVEDIGIMRGHRVIFLKVNPVQYNPAIRTIDAYSQIELRLIYDRLAQVQPIDERLKSAAFEEVLARSIFNYLDQDRFDSNDGPKDAEAVDYLILTHSTFNPPNDPNNPVALLESWKQQKGYRTKVVDVADIPGGQTSDDIKNYLQNAYDQWAPPPTYVLLVGDTEFITTTREMTHPSHSNTWINTDLHYSTLDGNDFYPDLFLGRLPVDTLAEAQAAVGRIIDYEKTPPNAAGFYEDVTMIAVFEDDTDPPNPGPDPRPEDGTEDRPWIENVEAVRTYLENNNYDVERIYATSSGWPGDPGSSQPNLYEDFGPLPDDLTVAGNPGAGIPPFGWNGGANDINTAVGNGTFLITFRDHGGRRNWSWPIDFDTGDVDALSNGGLSPVILSYACQNSWFDNEIDDGTLNTGVNSESFGEHWIRDNNGGAVAFIGSTRNSQTGPNDYLMFGMHQAIWPDFVPAPDTTGYPAIPDIASGPLPRMGQIHNFGKIYMANAYSGDRRQRHFEIYQLFGDPEMPIWTEMPGNLRVVHPAGIGATGTQDFVVKITDSATNQPVNGIVIALTRDDQLIKVRQTNPGGIARFTLNSVGTGDIQLTATGFNYRPYEGSLVVKSGGGRIDNVHPEDGVDGTVVQVSGSDFSGSEEIEVTLDAQGAVTTTASGGAFGTAGMTAVTLTVPGQHPLGPVNVAAYGQTSSRYAVDVFSVRSQNPIDLYTYSQWDSSTWNLTPSSDPVWNSPDIQVYDGGTAVASNNLTVGQNYTFEANIHNDTNFKADNVQVDFWWADFGVGQDQRVWQLAGSDALDVPGNSVQNAEIDWSPPHSGHLCIKVSIYHIEDINLDNNEGQENLHVGPTASPAKVPFKIYNPTRYPVQVYLEVRQLLTLGEEGQEPLWEIWIEHPEPQTILPGDYGEAYVIFDPKPADVGSGAVARFVLTAFVDGKIIGGTEFEIRVR